MICHLFNLGLCKNLQELNVSDCSKLTVSIRSPFYCCLHSFGPALLECPYTEVLPKYMPVCSFRIKHGKKQTMLNIGKKRYPTYLMLLLNPVDICPTLESSGSGNNPTTTQTCTMFIFKAMCLWDRKIGTPRNNRLMFMISKVPKKLGMNMWT